MSEHRNTVNIAESTEIAIQLFRDGSIEDAEILFRTVLNIDPNHPVALHFLGLIAHHEGKHQLAAQHIGAALAVSPNYVEAHSNLGIVYQALGKVDDAIESYSLALKVDPSMAEAHNNLGFALRGIGRLEEAISSFEKATAINPNYEEAHYNLATTFDTLKKPRQAMHSYRKALSLNPNSSLLHNNLGNVLRILDDPKQASECFQKALFINPDSAEINNNFGLSLYDLGRIKEAEQSFQRALTINSSLAEIHNNLGLTLDRLGREKAAEESFHRAFTIKPELVEAHFNFANLMRRTSRLDQALSSYQTVIHLKPHYPHAHYNLGLTLHSLGQLNEAIIHYQKALAYQPKFAEIYNNLGNAFWALGDAESAVAQYKQAVAIKPFFPEVYNNLGAIYQTHRRFEEAHINLQKALSQRPQYAEAHNNLANTLLDQGHFYEAVRQLEVAISHKPQEIGWQIKRSLFFPVIPASTEQIQDCRNNLMHNIAALKKTNPSISDPILEVGMTNFHLAYHDLNNTRIMEEIASFYIRACPYLEFKSKHCSSLHKRKEERIKIGFISSYFWDHTIGKLIRGIIQNLSHETFKILLFRPPVNNDAVSKAIDQAAEKIVTLSGHLQKDQLKISDEQLDILFYPDIGMSALSYFLAFARLAPVQVVSWGHPDTTGIPNIDYFLSSELLETQCSSAHYTEKLVKLETVPTFYFKPQQPTSVFKRDDFSLPKGVRLYVCPQALFKFHPEFDDILRELLQRDPQGRIVLIDDTPDGSLRKLLQRRWYLKFPDIISHFIFLPRMSQSKFIGLLDIADSVLDIPSFSGGNSSLEAFSVGAPIVTWPQTFMRSRVTAAFYKQMGLNDLIATDRESYLALALKLAQNTDFHKQMRSKIVANTQKLYENLNTLREIENFFITAFENSRRSDFS